ncbi:glycoside hydrolase family 76 protein [Thalassotalea sp. ND16A]|uniref:glycoside hydrolase family 76 protein n=1 Tax=Thalassotalea sp. ND16A TaxID=1535422 RepID=UPI000519F144|nr:glycoside hydrolase family 76 protein [Thalassotalea sp. ND16A]KGJ94225.1 hypothetical protein ND16A_1431 [Thalassotalea sp. ND16A]
MIKQFTYKAYCTAHKLAKILLNRYKSTLQFRMVDIDESDFSDSGEVIVSVDKSLVKTEKNDSCFEKKSVYPVENIVPTSTNNHLKNSFKKSNLKFSYGIDQENSRVYWESFICRSRIPQGYKNEALYYTGFIGGTKGWCLPSWIWTNAALVKHYCLSGNYDEAIKIVKLLSNLQLPCGGWVVRDDYTTKGPMPIVAPNDSAYIANNAFLELYKVTKDDKYLNIAVKCADWIISVARPDGLVFTGYDERNGKWITNHIIVDIGFTAALFANIYEITKEVRYKAFLEKFVESYVSLFFVRSNSGFATSIDSNNNPNSGMFARGQAWALEGLIPAYKVLQSPELKVVIDSTVANIISYQLPNGGWPYNFKRPLLGEDCKGVPIIAKSILDWGELFPNDFITRSAFQALNWCREHTGVDGDEKGGIFSYCMEGAVVHNFYTSTAFVYSSAYAIQLEESLGNYELNYNH